MTEQSPIGESRSKARIGAIVPMSNTNLEPDLVLLRPDGVSLHVMRAGGYDLDRVPDSDQMRKFAAASLDSVLEALMAARPDVILYGCTSATLSQGPAYDTAFRERIEAAAGVPAVTAAGALVEALADLEVRAVGFASPYTEQLNNEAAAFLEATGLDVVNRVYVGEDLGNYGQGALTPEAVLALGLRAEHAEARAVVLSCTDLRAVEVIAPLEERLAKPVVTSNQAMMHAAVKRLGLGHAVPGRLGRVPRPETRAAE